MNRLMLIIWVLLAGVNAMAEGRSVKVATLFNDVNITLDWSDGTLRWSASRMDSYHNIYQIVAPSRLRMETSVGVWGENVGEATVERISTVEYEGAIVEFEEFAVEIRAYERLNRGVAYRFISKVEGDYMVTDELAEFALSEDDMAWVPYVNHRADATSDYATQFETSFENIYTHTSIANIDCHRLVFAPIVVEERNGMKLWISEVNLEDYPGMFLSNCDQDGVIDTEFAPVPDEVEQGGHNMLQGVVKSRKPYIAECEGARAFPWRVVAIGETDVDIANSNIVELLADECRIEDTSWIKPGKVAWEWWNDWGLEGVDFEVGINTETYKYYIDFASRYGIEYVILDEGWSVMGEADLYSVVPEIDLEEIIAYGQERGVGIILWAGYWALNRDIEGICRHYAEMGIKGFKVDFMDRDDQQMVRFVYDVAETAARYHLLVDYHGIYKPTGLQYTYPNAINFEGVHGLETMKWLGAEHDQITYDVTIPFIRGVAGPMDYTPGAMRNAPREAYEPNYSRPMSQGTRCHQLAMYVLYNQPLAMLCDSPTEYDKEPEFTRLIAEIPTDMRARSIESGEIGKYVEGYAATGEGTFYYAGLNGDKPRRVVVHIPVNIDFDSIDLYVDDMDADSDGSAYRHIVVDFEEFERATDYKVEIDMAPGGGYLMIIKGELTPIIIP